MINVIWLGMLFVGTVFAAIHGNMESVTKGILEGAESGVAVSLGLISVLVFWLGIMRVAEDARLVETMARWLRPLARFLYPSVPANHPAMGTILANMSANILGLGSAATPLGLKAMKELQELNQDKNVASDAMCTLLAINTSGLTLIPATVIAVRLEHGSVNPTDIVGSTLLATIIATSVAIILDRYYRARDKRKKART